MEIYKSDISKDVKQPVSHTGGGSGIYANQGEISVGGMNLATQTWIEDNYISKKFFNKLFLVHGDGTTLIEANDLSTAIESLEAKIGLWTNSYISALGQNSSQGGGSGTSYNRLDAWSNYDSTKSGWVLSALLGNDLNSRVTSLENGQIEGVATQEWVQQQGYLTELSAATTNALGAIKIGYSANGNNYPVLLDNNNRAYVNVPWTDTTYTIAGLMGSSAKGSTTQPIYWNGSEFVNTSYTLGKSVPSDAKFTDTTYSANNGVGLSGTTFYNSGVRAVTLDGNHLRVNTNGTITDSPINADLLDGQHGSYYAKASDVSTLQGYFNNGVANNAYNVNGFHVLYTDFLYSYSKKGMLEQSAMSGDFWYAKIFLERGWEPSKSAIVLKSEYSDIRGEVYLNLLSYAYVFNAYVTDYNGCNIVGIRINWENDKSVIYLKLKKPTGSLNGSIYYYGGYDATITVSAIDLLGNGLTYFTLEAGKTYGVMANKLATARTLWGQRFDGTDNVSGAMSGVTNINSLLYLSTNVGIGTSNPTEKLDVNGNINASGTIHSTTGIYSEGYVSALGQNTSSDIHLKDVQGDVDLPIDMLANAPSKAFVWKGNKALGEQVGTIAQYWQKHLPQVVHDNNGYLAMQYDVAALLGVISVAKKVKSHEERIAELERENRELKKRIKRVKI